MTSKFFPIVKWSLFSKYGIWFCEITDIESVIGAEDIIETVVNVSVLWSELKRGFGKLCGLGFNLNISLLFVEFLMMEFVFVHVINLIEFFALKLLWLHQGIQEPCLVGQLTQWLRLSDVCSFLGDFKLFCVVEVMALNVLFYLRVEVLLVTCWTEYLKIVFVVRFSLVEGVFGLSHLIDLTAHHWSERQEFSLICHLLRWRLLVR